MSPCRLIDHPEALAGEVRIRWAHDAHPERFAYVREGVVSMPFRRRRPASWRVPGRMVAWAEVEDWVLADTPGRFRRRVWWLAARDPDAGGCPAEAVDPCSIRPGHESRPPRSTP